MYLFPEMELGTEVDFPLFFKREQVRTIGFRGKGLAEVSAAVPGGWQAVVSDISGKTEGTIKLTAPQRGELSAALYGDVVLTGKTGESEVVTASFSVTLLNRLEMPYWVTSSVTDLFFEGKKMGEMTREYIKDFSETQRATVVYPYDASDRSYGNGIVLENGATYGYRTMEYLPAQQEVFATAVYTEDGKILLPGDALPSRIYPGFCAVAQLMKDREGNRYGIVRVNGRYWMAENLRVLTYRDGAAIGLKTSKEEWTNNSDGACCYAAGTEEGKKLYGLYYNAYAVLRAGSAGLAPEGWHIPTREEYRLLSDHLGQDGSKLMAVDGWSGGKNLDQTGFSALPGG